MRGVSEYSLCLRMEQVKSSPTLATASFTFVTVWIGAHEHIAPLLRQVCRRVSLSLTCAA